MLQILNFHKKIQIISLLLIAFFAVNSASAQSLQNDRELIQAMDLVKQNRHIDALPILEKVAPRYPNDAEIQANFAVAILVNSVAVKDEKTRRSEVFRAGEILKKAKTLGTKNVLALHFLDLVESGADIDSVSGSSNKQVEDLIREGEGFFGRGEYEKAFVVYERAFKLDPKSYEAALFAGDSFYAQKKYKESEPWFAKAAALNPNREQAHRFWADALANQGKTKESLPKIADAFIAEPNSRVVFDALIESVKNHGSRKSSPFIVIPSKSEGEIVIDGSVLRADDGTIHWNSFTETRKSQIEKFKSVANGREFVSTVSEDVEALKSVSAAANKNLLANKNLKLSKSIENLIKLDSLGMLDVYTILFIHGGNNSSEYDTFREKNRERMRKFLVDYFAEDKL